MRTLSRARLVILLLFSLLLSQTASLLAADKLPVIADDWQLERIWKDANKSKSHFHQGVVGVKNTTGADMSKAAVVVSMLAPSGELIARSKSIRLGTISPGKSSSKKFEIDKGVQFAELRVHLTYKQNGENKAVDFSSTDGGKPQSISVDKNAKGVKLLALDVNMPVKGKGPATITARIRNVGGIEAKNLRLTVNFTNDKGESKRNASDKLTKNGPYEVRISKATKKETTFEILLNATLAPGETRSFSNITLKGAPRYAGYSTSLGAEYAEEKGPAAPDGITIDTGQGEITISKIAFEKPNKKGRSVTFFVKNDSPDIPADSLMLTFVFFAKDNKKLGARDFSVPNALPKGKTIKITSPALKVPDFAFYELALSFAVAPEPVETFEVEIKEGEPIPEGVKEVIEVPEE